MGLREPLQKVRQLGRQWGRISRGFLRQRMDDRQFARVQKHAFQALPRERLVQLEIAVLVVACNGIAQMR
jgi:hypothetical protein